MDIQQHDHEFFAESRDTGDSTDRASESLSADSEYSKEWASGRPYWSHSGKIVVGCTSLADDATMLSPITIDDESNPQTAELGPEGELADCISEALSKTIITPYDAEIYQKALDEGRINEQQLQKILGLTEDSRISLEKEIVGKGVLSKKALAELLALEPHQLEALFKLSGKEIKQTIYPALDKGLITRERIAELLNPATKDAFLKVLETGLKNPDAFTPEMIEKFANLAPEARRLLLSRNHTPKELALLLQNFEKDSLLGWSELFSKRGIDANSLAKVLSAPPEARPYLRRIVQATEDATAKDLLLDLVLRGKLSTNTLKSYDAFITHRQLGNNQHILRDLLSLPHEQRRVVESILEVERIKLNERLPSKDLTAIVNEVSQHSAYVDKGLVDWKYVYELSVNHGAQEIILRQLLKDQATKADASRISKDNIAKLTELSRAREITPGGTRML